MRRPRAVDITYYEWSVSRWLNSRTRLVLSPEGRQIFRELLDQCYAAGGIPKDLDLMARRADCTEEQMRRVWPLIEHHFRADKKDKNLLFFGPATVWRGSCFRYVDQQKKNALSTRRNTTLYPSSTHFVPLKSPLGTDKSGEVQNSGPVNGSGVNDMGSGGFSGGGSLTKRTKRTKRTKVIKRADESFSPPPVRESPSLEEHGNLAASPPLDSPPPAAIEPEEIPEIDKLCFISRELTYYVNELCHLGWQPADEKICAEILKSIEGDLDFFTAKLGQLWKSRRASPKKSYGWFTSVLRKES